MKRVVEEIVSALDREDELKEEAYRLHRDAIRVSREAIKRVAEGGSIPPEILKYRDRLNEMVENNPVMHRYGFIDDALAEISEALIFERVMKEGEIPPPTEIEIPPRAYLLGLSDVVGELRRVVVKRLAGGDLPGAREVLNRMEEIFHIMDGLVYPSSIIPIKRKQDVARSLLDRTEGEYLVALLNRRKEGG